jgi:outer membrane lipoprotein carrier protein
VSKIALLTLLTFLALSPGARAAGPDALEVARRVQSFYDKTKSYRAKFRQSYFIRMQNVRRSSSGRLAFTKPGRMSFRYDPPASHRVVSDGKTVKVYEPENARLFETKIERSQYPAALSFLTGKGRLTRDFKLRLLDARRLKVKNGYVLEGVPRNPSPAYQRVLFYVDAATSQVRRVLVLDAQGNRNRFDFDEPAVNEAIPASEFRFVPPPGTAVVKP